MSRTHLLAVLLAFCMTAGCKAQVAPSQTAEQHALDAATLSRHIEVLVRSQFNVPEDYSVSLGDRKPSAIAGYDSLPITFSRGDKSKVEDFLISTDNKTLARLEKFDLATDPVFSIDVSGRPIRGNPNAKVTRSTEASARGRWRASASMERMLRPANLGAARESIWWEKSSARMGAVAGCG